MGRDVCWTLIAWLVCRGASFGQARTSVVLADLVVHVALKVPNQLDDRQRDEEDQQRRGPNEPSAHRGAHHEMPFIAHQITFGTAFFASSD